MMDALIVGNGDGKYYSAASSHMISDDLMTAVPSRPAKRLAGYQYATFARDGAPRDPHI